MKLKMEVFEQEINNCLNSKIYSDDINWDALFNELFPNFESLSGITYEDVVKQLNNIIKHLKIKSKEEDIKKVVEKELLNYPELRKVVSKLIE